MFGAVHPRYRPEPRGAGGLSHQGHLDGPTVVAVLKYCVSGGGDGDCIGCLVGIRRDHAEDVAIYYGESIRVTAGLNPVGRVLPVQECILGGYGSDHARDIRPVDGRAVYYDIPATEVLVELGCAVEHQSHVGDRGDVPGGDVLIEGGGVLEHDEHASYRGNVPCIEGLIEGGGLVEHAGHVGN